MSHEYGSPTDINGIRETCFTSAEAWTAPTGDELRIMLHAVSLSQTAFARMVGVSDRTVRRWTEEGKEIAYSAWCVLAEEAGIKAIWK